MADVVVSAALDAPGNSLYVPWRGVARELGPIGTLDWHRDATGDAAGGVIEIRATATRLMFGFHPLLVPRMLGSSDNQAAGTPVRIAFNQAGNERLKDEAFFVVDQKKETVSGVNVNQFDKETFMMVIEPNQESGSLVMTYHWTTNTDGKVYHARAFFDVYDLEAYARRAEGTATLFR